ncbi:MAG: helix-turn-helix domain-containing protein [Succinivibrionaceae bacterium]|nr:helix-turn-helix domain-containing protein [Succinivibrionaceae bacterium]
MENNQPLGLKIKRIRRALNLSREEFAKMLDVPFSTLKNYELLYRNVNSTLLLSICSHPVMHRYTMWLVSNRVYPQIGQIEPPGLDDKSTDE